MRYLHLYRFFISILAGATFFFTVLNSWWAWLCSSILFRAIWFFIERKYHKFLITKYFLQHSYDFKQLMGPYGIRIINKAETDLAIKESLSEVFTPDLNKLRENVKTLEMMDSLFQAGLRPDGDAYQLHDLKLKYGKYRLDKSN